MTDLFLERTATVWNEVEGWLGDRVHTVLRWIGEFQAVENVRGDIVEIGVHHGKFLLSMTPLLERGERAIAVDLWENQSLNLDGSGCGSSEIFQKHSANLAPEAEIRLISGDSMALSAQEIRAQMSGSKCKLFSVDGGHTVSHVINDMLLAQDLIAQGGIVALDDFLGPSWPSVTEGLFEYLRYHNVRLAPFLVFQNKLWLTTFSVQPKALASVTAYFEGRVGVEWHERWRYSEIKGWKVLTFA